MSSTRAIVFVLGTLGLAAMLGCSGGGAGTGGTGGSGTGASTSASASGSGGASPGEPQKPADLVTYVSGDPADADVTPQGPGLILMGGGPDVDAAFTWWKPIVNGGDVVVLRASGDGAYDDYLYQQIGGFDSVETLMVTTTDLANSDYVAWKIGSSSKPGPRDFATTGLPAGCHV
jgi:hypothetical protein